MLLIRNIANSFNNKITQTKSTAVFDKVIPKFGAHLNLSNDSVLLRSPFQVLLDEFGIEKSPQDINKSVLKSFSPGKLIGEGAESRAYLIGESYVLKIPRYMGDDYIKALSDANPLKASDNSVLGLRNFGQPIAEAKNGVSISKLVHGTPLYSSLPNKWIDYDLGSAKIKRKDSIAYLSELKDIVAIPDKIITNYINDIMFLKQKECKVDFVNPNNFLYDKDTQQLNIIDVEPGARVFNSAVMLPVNILRPLVDGYNLKEYYACMKPEERKQALESISDLYTRIHNIYYSIVGEQRTIDSIPIPVEDTSCYYLRGLNGFDFSIPDLRQAISRYYDSY